VNYTTADAIELQNNIRADLEQHGPDVVFDSIHRVDPELLALTLVLSTLSR
jgi:hypothetical protein